MCDFDPPGGEATSLRGKAAATIIATALAFLTDGCT
jgi:hypothetical protein